MILSTKEKQHYNRHLILEEVGETGQLKLKQAKVLVIGAGGLGCPVMQYLTAAGVGTIGIVDDDIIEISNLQRQVLYSYDDLGKPKAQTAAVKLSRLNPLVKFQVYLKKITFENALELFSKYDIIVDGTDNFPTRYLVNDAAVLSNKPLVFGSIFKFEGQVSVFNYEKGPTYRCLYPNPPKNKGMSCSDIGVLGVLPGVIGSLQANEVLKIILELGTPLSGQLLLFNALTGKQNILKFEKNHDIHIERLESSYHVACDLSEIEFDNYQANPSKYNVLDVRTRAEREQFAINSIHIPFDEIMERLDEIPNDKDLIVYCQSGIRSKKVIDILIKNGFDMTILNLKDGLKPYQATSSR